MCGIIGVASSKASVDKLMIGLLRQEYRGYDSAGIAIFDEAQNSSLKEIITILTRLGHFSRCFILADPMQTDLSQNKMGGFKTLKKLFSDEESVANGIKTFKFDEDDVMRSEIVKFRLKKFRELHDD